MKERLDGNCKGCKYDGSDEGGYFCLSCMLIGKFIPHIEDNKEEQNGKKEERGGRSREKSS